MSFALEFRKQQQQKQREALRVDEPEDGFVASPAEASDDTRGNRRRVLLALVIAGAVLSIFNSDGLVRYTHNLAGNPVGERLIVLSESWHELMQEKKVTRVADHIKGSLAMVRDANWRDLTFGFNSSPATPARIDMPQPVIVPASDEAPYPLEPKNREPENREIAKPSLPVLRASVEPRQ